MILLFSGKSKEQVMVEAKRFGWAKAKDIASRARTIRRTPSKRKEWKGRLLASRESEKDAVSELSCCCCFDYFC